MTPPDRAWLARACSRLRRAHWPTELDQVLAHPIYGRCVRGMAACLQRQAHRASFTPPRVQTPAPALKPTRGRDLKRAAAGDCDD